MTNMIRINTRISSELNNWLDEQSKETGMSKSTMVMLALEDYKKQRETLKSFNTMSDVMRKLEEIEKRLEN